MTGVILLAQIQSVFVHTGWSDSGIEVQVQVEMSGNEERRQVTSFAVYVTQLQNMVFLLLNDVRLDSLLTQHSMRYINEKKFKSRRAN